MSTQSLSRVLLGGMTAGLLASSSPAFAANPAYAATPSETIVRFDASYAEPAPPTDHARQCWQWSAAATDWTWACRPSAYMSAYPANPLQPPTPLRYDYPDPAAVRTGSTLSLVLHAGGREPGVPSHAD